MTTARETSDASHVYRETTALNIALVTSSSQCGNLADATKNAIVLSPTLTMISAPFAVYQKPLECDQVGW